MSPKKYSSYFSQVPAPIINGALLFRKCPTFENMKRAGEKFLVFERFRSILKRNAYTGSWSFEETDKFNQVFSSRVVRDEMSLIDEIARISNEPLDISNSPAWTLTRIENTGEGLSAVVFRIHHVIGDGISLV